MLGRVSQAALARRPAIRATWRSTAAPARPTTRGPRKGEPLPDGKLIAYFSAEYGLTECLPVYSGGLGILSGDHLKSSSDQDYPLIGLGLLYQQGYFRQFLNPDGWQQERYPMNDFYTLPLTPVKDAEGRDLKVTVKLPTGNVFIQVWKLYVGRITLFLLDTNIPDNVLPQDRDITDSLYGGDIDTRIRQEIVLGIGGMRALAGDGPETHGVPHERRPLGLSGAGTDPLVHARRESGLRRSARSRARQQCLHHPHAGSGGHRYLRRRPDVPLLRRLLQRCADRFPAIDGAGAAQRFQSRRAVLHGGAGAAHLGVPQRRQPAAPRSLAGDVSRPVAAAAAVGGAHHLHHQRSPSAQLAERRPGAALRSIPASRTGATASTTPPFGSR